MGKKIVNHGELEVYQRAVAAAMQIFELSKLFPRPETYALTDQIRRSSRSVCANLAEAWRKRRYERSFISKLTDVEGEAAETQVWLEFAGKCGYLEQKVVRTLHETYAGILRTVVGMINNPQDWIIGPRPAQEGLAVEGNVLEGV